MTPVEFSLATALMAVFAGLASVASPCVLPVVPIIVTGTEEDHRHRPLLIVLGLSAGFIAMGAATSLFGGAIAPVMPVFEKVAGVVIILFGVLMLFGWNLFKNLHFFQRIGAGGKGRWSGLVLGLTLGLVWIPCVGPMLSGVLTLVATQGSLVSGVVLLAFYSLGFAIPMLLAGYASQRMRHRIRLINAYPMAVRVVSALILIGFGIAILNLGMLELGMTT
ncbi:cytochrome c biogenesis CcdA family protein [Geoalkalibacter halelectricus]|uniref:Cytochrome c biogenesis CcdA family protein n=1 Tax=Geoalkalibacter halelectricus TaxID=2847045 RepID=A0ABY5ZKN8_9BACT|nr:cytochrome c biogenesis CcdA family protein [Geoalkalibacter halelectricus]MDO3378261.1 cytochrome c biogenesis CcdA family protein [Geoalkalibacter halelectricus]UWZ79148.1 cytochrome c biogenesis CcdA family protein [Geoalkalibacter halelectricus]